MEFNKSEIKVLDNIVTLLLLNGTITMDTLIENGLLVSDNTEEFEIDLINTPENIYNRYLSILSEKGLCTTKSTKDGRYAQETDFTYDFLQNGGFKKLYSIEKKSRRPLTAFQIISIILTILFGSWGVYNEFRKNDLKDKFSTLSRQNDSINIEFRTISGKYDSVTKSMKNLKLQTAREVIQHKSSSK